jgi:hypothetical protein
MWHPFLATLSLVQLERLYNRLYRRVTKDDYGSDWVTLYLSNRGLASSLHQVCDLIATMILRHHTGPLQPHDAPRLHWRINQRGAVAGYPSYVKALSFDGEGFPRVRFAVLAYIR